MKNGKKIDELILSKLENIEREVKEVRQSDIPKLKLDMAVMKEKTSNSAKIISGIGGLVAVAVSTAIAVFK